MKKGNLIGSIDVVFSDPLGFVIGSIETLSQSKATERTLG